MGILATLVLALGVQGMAPAPLPDRWWSLGPGGDAGEVLVDWRSIRVRPAVDVLRPFVVREAWLKVLPPRGSGEEREAKILYLVDCARMAAMFEREVALDARGLVLADNPVADMDFNYRPIMPETNEELAALAICAKAL